MPLTDISPYRKYVEQFDLSEEQKVELIHAVWNLMEGVVDLAFGKSSVQLCGAAAPTREQDGLQAQTAKVISASEREGRSKHGHNGLRGMDGGGG